MKYKNILVTGARGFIGFNALQLWKSQYPDIKFVALDANTYADKFCQTEKDEWLSNNNISHYELYLDTCDAEYMLPKIIEDHNIDCIVHMAACSHVDNSISNPSEFVYSNVVGTMNVLNVVRKYNIRLHIVSTDEVYGITYPEDNVYENFQLKPSSPYSASKASADLLTLSYVKTFGINATISRCTNNAGIFQHSEKLIPTIIKNAINNNKIPIYGNGLQKRHWIYVNDHNDAIMNIVESGEIGKIYNIAPIHENYITNIELVKYILDYLNKPISLIENVADRAAHDVSYYIYSRNYTCKTKYTEFMPSIIDWYSTKI